MRFVQLAVPAGKRERILETLEDEGIDYVVSDETSGREYDAVVYFPLPTSAVEPVLDELKRQRVEEDAYTVVVDAETVVSRKFDELREQYEDGDVDQDRISRQELRSHAEDLTPTFGVYVTLTVVSALVATAGLLLDSPAVVVGSMVIAPLIGPALGASIGTVLDERELLRSAITYQVVGVTVAIAAAMLFAALVRFTHVVPPGVDIATIDEIAERLSPDLLSLVIALGAGVAGILSIATGVSVALVGVMIAAALIPPAATAGIALAFGEPMAAVGSTVLVLVNVLSVNLAGLLTLWYAGYRPESLFDLQPTKERFRRQVLVLALVVLLFSTFLGAITYNTAQAGAFEGEVRDEVESMLEAEYEELRLVDLEVRLDNDYPFQSPERVIITIAGPPGETYPELAQQLYDRINQHTDGPVAVEIRYVEAIEN